MIETDLFKQHSAEWIWIPAESPQNTFAAFRRTVAVTESALKAILKITADARYEVFVNGVWVGHGPPRSFPSPWPVDTYDIAHLLKNGDNVIAVLVQHFGVGTFQYIETGGAPGLLAELAWADDDGGHQVVTDDSWRCQRHAGFAQVVPRISCQLPWEEQFDARTGPGDSWTSTGYDDADWDRAVVLRPAGEAPHPILEARDIPFLTREPFYPTRLMRTEVVRPASYTWSLNPRAYLNSTDMSANQMLGRMYLAVFIFSDEEQPIEFHLPHGTPGQWKLNGELLKFDDHTLQSTDSGIAHATLDSGGNTLLVRLPEGRHLWTCVINAWTKSPVTFGGSPRDAPTPWIAVGPFEGAPTATDRRRLIHSVYVEAETTLPGATAEAWEAIWERGALASDDYDIARPLTLDMISDADVFAICTSDRVFAETAAVRVDEIEALSGDTADWTTIYPSLDGDVRLLLDYGQELVGYHEFEIDATAGTIVDFHDFEFIQRDGRINLCEGMNNSFRYTCREGAQHYRTFVRHGLRYCYVTLRNFDRPVRMRAVRVLLSTYPVAKQGAFECSDQSLTEIYKVGAHSVRICSEDTYTDCPTYEQTHWIGDARNEALVDLVANGDPRLSRHCWIQTGHSLDRSALVEAQVPSSWLTILPAWSFLWMRWAHEHYLLTGDTEFGNEALTFLQRNIDGIEQHLDARHLFQINAWNMFDWAPMDTPCDGIVTHQICLAVLGLRQSAELARLLGRTDRAEAWDALATRMSIAVNAHLWSDERQAYLDCIRYDGTPSTIFSQQTQTAAFISGVASDDRAARCREIIEVAPEGFVPAGSPFFMFFVLEMLVKESQFDRLLQTVRDYWGIQIEAGATTYWEMYYPKAERHTRSHCHGWSAAPTFFLAQHVLGIQPFTPGYETILVRPQPSDLRWAQGRVPTPNGTVEIYWQQSAADPDSGARIFDLQLTSPRDVEVRIVLPYSGEVTVAEGHVEAVYDEEHGRVLLTHGVGRLALSVESGGK